MKEELSEDSDEELEEVDNEDLSYDDDLEGNEAEEIEEGEEGEDFEDEDFEDWEVSAEELLKEGFAFDENGELIMPFVGKNGKNANSTISTINNFKNNNKLPITKRSLTGETDGLEEGMEEDDFSSFFPMDQNFLMNFFCPPDFKKDLFKKDAEDNGEVDYKSLKLALRNSTTNMKALRAKGNSTKKTFGLGTKKKGKSLYTAYLEPEQPESKMIEEQHLSVNNNNLNSNISGKKIDRISKKSKLLKFNIPGNSRVVFDMKKKVTISFKNPNPKELEKVVTNTKPLKSCLKK